MFEVSHRVVAAILPAFGVGVGDAIAGWGIGMIVTIELVLTREIHDNGEMVMRLRMPSDYNSTEVLGMLESAKFAIYSNMRRVR